MAIAKTDVLARFAEFTPIGDPEWTAVIADATFQVNAGVWGSRATLATIYLTAHLLGVAHPGLIPSGRVRSESMDKVAYSYAVADQQAATDDFDSTPYGRLYKALRAQATRGRPVVA